MVNEAKRKMYDSFGPPSVVLCCESKAKLAMVEQVQRGVLLVVSGGADTTSRTGECAENVFVWATTQKPF